MQCLRKWVLFLLKNFDQIRSEFCTCHDSSAAMACAKLWPWLDHKKKIKSRRIFTRFQFWAHKFVKCGNMIYILALSTKSCHAKFIKNIKSAIQNSLLYSSFLQSYQFAIWSYSACNKYIAHQYDGVQLKRLGTTSIHWRLCTSNSFENGNFLADMLIFMPTKWILPESQILSHWYHFEEQLIGNNIGKKIEIMSTDFLAILICIYKNKLLEFFFLLTPPNAPKSHLPLRKHHSIKSC